eukprot:Em0012g413a
MEQLSEKQRKEVVARIAALPSSGLTGGISSDISRHYKSFVGRDFKFLAQIAVFIFSPYLSEAEIEVWLALPMVFKMVYCDEFKPQKIELYRDVCHRFARAIDCYSVTWRKKLKIHLILHLPDSMLRFWPASSFNTERCGEDLVNLYHTKEVQAFLGGEVQERGSGIHKHGTLRKCSARTKAPLASVPITLEGKTMSLEEIDAKFTVLLPHGISNLTPVQWGGIGDWIVYWQRSHSLVRYLEPVLSGTEPVLNEWGCSLLTLTNVIRCIASTLVNCAVSVVHQCDNQCVLAEQETTSRIERVLMVVMAFDLLHCNWMARRDARQEMVNWASAPNNSAIAADPLVAPASVKVVRLSRGLAGDQDNVDSKNPKMCQFQATTSMQSGIHQAQGEG